ncbi:thioesterase II family protein [Xanthomonas sp. NCPPB 3582]|uniref:thioesterase II family protein n=1 Tax=Xanthomonas sp. NCPPB 3582 TaxID=487557 RepID=UPI003558806A
MKIIQSESRQSPWFMRFKRNHQARLRLFCFPYAGGSAGLFEPWGRVFEGVDVVGVQLPGRSNRISEKPIDSLAEIVARLIVELRGLDDLPFVFFGHSNGALICFELARELQRRGIGGLQHIILSGRRAPHLPRVHPNTHDLPHDAFIEELRSINGTPEELLSNMELMNLFVPVLRADFKVSETHKYCADIKLNTPASIFWGRLDTDIPEADIEAWRANFETGDIAFAEFSGDHFFIHSQQALVLERVGEILGGLTTGRVAEDLREATG